MSNKVKVDLNELNKKINTPIPIIVGKEEFEIFVFPIGAARLYNIAVNMSKDAISNYSEFNKILLEIKTLKKGEEGSKKLEELENKSNILKDKIPSDEDILEKLWACMDIILTANGYEFNQTFWENNCDTNKLWQFIHLAANKGNLKEQNRKKD